MKKIIISLILIMTCVLTVARIVDEADNKNVQIGVRYEDMLLISQQEHKEISEVLKEFQKLGITSITVDEKYLDTLQSLDLNIIPIIREKPIIDGNFSYIFFEEDFQEDWAKQYGASLVDFYTKIDNPLDVPYARFYTDEKVPTISTPNRVDRYELALKERTNRIFIFILDENGINALKNDILTFITNITQSGYIVSKADIHELKAIFIKHKIIIYFLQAVALGLAIFFPCYAIYRYAYHQRDYWLISFLKITTTTTVGAIIISSFVSFENFRLGIDIFRGVKIAYIIPIIFVAILFKLKNIEKSHIMAKILSYLKGNWLKVVIYLIIMILIIYFIITRTGNAQITEIEKTLRQSFNSLFGIRPRAKEFIIGHPFLILALYRKKVQFPFIVFGTIGQVSIINTFMHLHTPFVVSLIRTFIGMILGILLGIILILIFRVINQWTKKHE
ncbi:hypothetical protein AN641_02070 [Candidatus Epulonipiscioides gigas]|nr:hypothetical protein AN641_02070 [Epulopiscium sp. SCG-C07WGA-EpuloA2]